MCALFCATLEPPSAPDRARKNSLSTSTTAQVVECPGAAAPNPSTGAQVWLEMLHSSELQLLMHECRSQFQLCIQGFARQFSDYLYNCTNPVFATLWSC